MRFVNDTILNATSVVASTASDSVEVSTILNLSVQVIWTSTTASFTLTLQESNNGTDWVDTNQTATVNNNSSSAIFKVADSAVKYIRVNVARTSGTLTTIKAIYEGKGF